MSIQLLHKRCLTGAAASMLTIALGFSLALIVANEKHGYVAVNTWFIILTVVAQITVALLTLSVVFLLRRSTRWLSVIAAVSALLLAAGYLVSIKALEVVGWTRYVP
jgi:hypothetical protein